LRFTPAPSALEGIAGHQDVAARRGASVQSEVALSGVYQRPVLNQSEPQGNRLLVRGRADGYDALRRRVDEVKTHRGEISVQPENHRALHWAQAKVYGWLLCVRDALPSIEVALVYYNVDTGKETHFKEVHEAQSLQRFFESLCETYLVWAEREAAHCLARNQQLNALEFVHGEFRAGQRVFAEAVYRACLSGRSVLAQAPTGIGKTLGSVFPALKALASDARRDSKPDRKNNAHEQQEQQQREQRSEPPRRKIIYLTAKTPGRQLAMDALQQLRSTHQPSSGLRVLELTARDKACEHPDKACHGESCPLANGFYDRLPQAREAATRVGQLGKHELSAVAREHQVCPYYLGQEMARWSDVMVGDYNHYFDEHAMLYHMAVEDQWQVTVLVDEAHNLVERARLMYSAELSQTQFDAVRKLPPKALKKKFQAVSRHWKLLSLDCANLAYQVLEPPPEKLLFALQDLNATLSEYLSDAHLEGEATQNTALQNFCFELAHFLRLAQRFGAHSMFDVSWQQHRTTLCFRNVVPATLLAERWTKAHGVVLFSATLQPAEFFQTMVGLPDDTVLLDVESPFATSQLEVKLARNLSTRYADRQRSLPQVVRLMGEQYRDRPGNYLAFFSSFDYLNMALTEFTERYPEIPVWSQERGMSEGLREAFLKRFTLDSSGLGFAVLGGAFAEGIDLPGARLIGAFIATLGLPQINPINEQMRERTEKLVGQGYEYTYLIPGLQKITQAAGRVIRTGDDQGIIVLMDDRFARPEVRRLLPRWWTIDA
jgi:DNA excision repair protein ERCC-2